MSEARTLDVYRGNERAGSIERTKHGSVFTYDAAWVAAHPGQSIAFNLPATTARHETIGVNLHTFFAGLLPEGARLKAMVRRLKTSEDDLLTLLSASGADCIGDVSAVPSGDSPEGSSSPTVAVDSLAEVEFAKLFAKSLTSRRSEPTIPGVQEKISAAMISFPVVGSAAAWILKLEPPAVPHLIANEAHFMGMARVAGIDVPDFRVVRDRVGAPGLLVERFDRVATEAGIARLHQEDACQILDRYPADKYLLATSEVMNALEVCEAPLVAKTNLLRVIAFSYLIGNGDLHGKNVSVRTRPEGLIELSPAYDLLSTFPYGDKRMALRLDARDDNLRRSHFVTFGARHGLRERAVSSMLDHLLDVAPRFEENLDAIGFDARKVRALRGLFAKRRADLAPGRKA